LIDTKIAVETDFRVAHNREFAILAAKVDILGADIDARTTDGANLMINYWRHLSPHSGNITNEAPPQIPMVIGT
jgi:hypothetical protein